MGLYGIYISGLGALGQSVKIDMIANNLANVQTPGFRQDQMSFQERLVEALEDRPDIRYYNAMVDKHGGAPFIHSVRFDKEAGGYERTQRPLDFAIKSKGFFKVRELETGKILFTRAGNFTLNSEGRLMTADGRYQALADDDTGIQLDPGGSSEIRLSPDGVIFQGTVETSKLGIVDFNDYDMVRKNGSNLFENLGSTTYVPAGLQVEQAVLENSSVNPVSEMVEMIKAMRALESNLQMIKFQDAALERSVNDLGRIQR